MELLKNHLIPACGRQESGTSIIFAKKVLLNVWEIYFSWNTKCAQTYYKLFMVVAKVHFVALSLIQGLTGC